jgi:hypothetical protein
VLSGLRPAFRSCRGNSAGCRCYDMNRHFLPSTFWFPALRGENLSV